MQFPFDDAKIVKLAEDMIGGLPGSSTFPHPPADATTLSQALQEFQSASTVQTNADLAATNATKAKKNARAKLVGLLKSDVNYVEGCTSDNRALNTVGWAAHASPHPLQAPGQPFDFQAFSNVSAGTVHVSYKAPATGGKPAAYQIMWRKLGESGPFAIAAVLTELEGTVHNLPINVRLELCVCPINKAKPNGIGPCSNTAVVIL